MSRSSCIVAEKGLLVDLRRTTTPRARKQYECGECGDNIPRGGLHEHVTGLVEGDWFSHRTCARCVNVRTDYFDFWNYGMLAEDFEAAHGFDYREGIPSDFAPCGEGET